MSVLNARVSPKSRSMTLAYRAQAQRLRAIIEEINALSELRATAFEIGEGKQRLLNALTAARAEAAVQV